MPKKRRVTGTTYHLVHRPHTHRRHSTDDAQSDDEGVMEWVHEADFRRGYRGKGSGGGAVMDDELLDVDAFARHLGVDRGALDGTMLRDDEDNDDGSSSHAAAHEQQRRAADEAADDSEDEYDDVSDDEDDECEDDDVNRLHDERDGGREEGTVAVRQAQTRTHTRAHTARDGHTRNVAANEDDDELFDDAVECEVTDDFLRQLMFGQPGNGGGADGDDAHADGDDAQADGDDVPPVYMDPEAWQLMSADERLAVRAAHGGTARRARVHFDDNDAAAVAAREGCDDEGGVGHEVYPTHDTTQRPLEAQFARMLHEFNVDACINDADTDDPRTHGALAMAQYMPALTEFVADRAGVDMATAEPAKNKGLLQQLRLLAHRAGVFDVDKDGGVFRTTVASEKEARFVAAFRAETERIRDEARRRMQQQQQQSAAADECGSGNRAEVSSNSNNDDEEEMVTVEVKTRRGGAYAGAERMDCESAVSAFSTYYNQPNVITASSSSSSRARRRGGAARSQATLPQQQRQDDEAAAAGATREAVAQLSRHTDETAEERRLRKQAVKAAQRARRHEKTTLRKTYKAAEAQEVRRAALVQADRATVHFV